MPLSVSESLKWSSLFHYFLFEFSNAFYFSESYDPSICLAIYGCGQLDRVADFINNSGEYVEDGVTFTPGMIAGQYAFEQVKLDRKGYDTRRLQKYLSFGRRRRILSEEEALQRADDLINNFTADFGHDEDGDATFRIKAQSYRLKKYDCHALWSMINQASLTIESVKPETFCDEDSDEDISSDSLDLVLTSRLFNKQNEAFATLTQYYTVSEGMLTVEDLLDYSLLDYPNFHDESGKTYNLMENIAQRYYTECIKVVMDYFRDAHKELPDVIRSEEITSMILQPMKLPIMAN